jgi:hypothetical protein
MGSQTASAAMGDRECTGPLRRCSESGYAFSRQVVTFKLPARVGLLIGVS